MSLTFSKGEDLKQTEPCFTNCSGKTETMPDFGDGDERQVKR